MKRVCCGQSNQKEVLKLQAFPRTLNSTCRVTLPNNHIATRNLCAKTSAELQRSPLDGLRILIADALAHTHAFQQNANTHG